MHQSMESTIRKPISIWSILLSLFVLYFLFRSYFFLVASNNTTLHFNKDFCGIAEIAKGSKESCSLNGNLRRDFNSSDYILDLKDGSSMYINRNAVSYISSVSK